MSSTMTTLELSSLNFQEQISPTLEQQATSELILGAPEQSGGSSVEVHSKRRAAIIITTVAGVNFLTAMGSGILTVALPTIAKDLGLSTELLLW